MVTTPIDFSNKQAFAELFNQCYAMCEPQSLSVTLDCAFFTNIRQILNTPKKWVGTIFRPVNAQVAIKSTDITHYWIDLDSGLRKISTQNKPARFLQIEIEAIHADIYSNVLKTITEHNRQAEKAIKNPANPTVAEQIHISQVSIFSYAVKSNHGATIITCIYA